MKATGRDYDQWVVVENLRPVFRVLADPNEQERLPMIPLKAKRGHIYVHVADTLGAVFRCGRVPTFSKKLQAEFPGVDVLEGDEELLITWRKSASWSVELMDRLGAKRRPRLSEAERERRRARLRLASKSTPEKRPVLAPESRVSTQAGSEWPETRITT